MEAGTTSTTASTTIADLLPRAAEMYADKVAVRHKVGDDWVDVTFAQVGETVSEIARGLIDLGIQKGDRVSLLCEHAPRVDLLLVRDQQRGRRRRPDLPTTNAPEECEWVAGDSESVGIVCEDASQIAKIQEVRANLPRSSGSSPSTPRATSPTRSCSTRSAPAAVSAPRRSSPSAASRSARTTGTPSSTRPARPARRRAASCCIATTARSST